MQIKYFGFEWVKQFPNCFTHFLIYFFTVNSIQGQSIQWSQHIPAVSLPESVKIWKGSRTSPSLEIWAIEVDLSDTTIAVRSYLDESKLVSEFAREKGAIAAINGGFFGNGTSFSTVVVPEGVSSKNVAAVTRNGTSYPVLRGVFSLNENYKPSIDWIYHFGNEKNDIYRFEQPLPYAYNDPYPKLVPQQHEGVAMTNILTAIGGGPVLVKNSKLEVTYNEEVMWGSGVGLSNRDARSAVGFTDDNRVFLITVDGRQGHSEGVSLSELGNIFISFGCNAALNLDGGGSSGLALNGSFINKPSELRKVPSILAVTSRKLLEPGAKPYFEKVIDTQDSTTIIEGSWTESANTGYYLPSRSLICKRGDGSQFVNYLISPPKDTFTQVYAWWVSSSNRAKDTPITIKHRHGEKLIYADQTKNGSSWQYLGEFSFRGDGSDFIKVSNNSNSGEYVVADAFKLLSFGKPDVTLSNINNNLSNDAPFEISISPNPAYGLMRVCLNDATNFEGNLCLINHLGIEIDSFTISRMSEDSFTFIVDTSKLTNGMYYIGSCDANNKFFKSIVVCN